MDAKQVLKIKEQITKNIESGDIRIVENLMKDLFQFRATTETLKSTRIGLFMSDIRKHKIATDDIKQVAKELVHKWKVDIGRKLDVSVDTLVEKGKSTPNSAQTPVERNVVTDGVNFKSTRDKVRDKYSKHIVGKVLLVEETIHQDLGDNPSKYKAKVRSIVSNLKGNPDLKFSILDDSLDPSKFAQMSTEEMMSKDRKEQVEKAKKESMLDAVTPSANASTTDMFKCGKCKARKTTYYQMQTRSADEPMTTFVTCVNCGNRWKFC